MKFRSNIAPVLGVSLSLVTAISVQAATIVGGSNLFTPGSAAQVESWLDGATGLTYSGSLAFTNIFDSVGKNSSDFHAAADGKGPTVVLYQVTPAGSAQSFIIGGFDPQSWNSSGTYIVTPALVDRTGFVFNLSNNDIRYQERASFNGQWQTFNYSQYGPTFGGGHDLWSDTSLTFGYVFSYSYCADSSSVCNGHPNLFDQSGQTNFTISEIEVFTISADTSQTPIPAALPLFVSGFGLIGLLARRRKQKCVGS